LILDKLFGFTFKSKDQEEEILSITKDNDEGAKVVVDNHILAGSASSWGINFNVDTQTATEHEMIEKYREISLIPELEKAINIIIDEAISSSKNNIVDLDLDDLKYPLELKKRISEEFDHIINLLNFNNLGFEIFKRWYIDGRIYYQVIINKEKHKEKGISKLVYLDPRKVKKVKKVKSEKDPRTGVNQYKEQETYYEYNENGFGKRSNDFTSNNAHQLIKVAEEAIVSSDSGLLDPSNTKMLSHLHKAIRPANQLKSLEDATMIYRISRAPERRIFYIDVGNLPPAKAEQVLKKQMEQYKSKQVYDPQTGTIKTDPKHLTLIEDYWLPRRQSGKATEITTLPAGSLGGDLNELNYFLQKLYNSLNVPITRLNSENGFTLGKSTEITRDEVNFTKFINRLRRRFSNIFKELLRRQLALKNIMSPEEFDEIRNDINFIFSSENHFNELVEAEIRDIRLSQLERIINFSAGGQMPIFSKEYIMKNILHLSDEEINEMNHQIGNDIKSSSKSEES